MFRLERPNHDSILLPADLPIVIGRGQQCELQLDDPAASRIHCRIIASDGKVALNDAGSRWGTFVNGRQVQQCDLKPGDSITVGETVLRLAADVDPERTTLARKSQLDRPDNVETIAPRPAQLDPTASYSLGGDSEFEVAAAHAHGPSHIEASQFLGQTFHRYKVQETIAKTSSGIVFRAKESRTGRTVALKIFQPTHFEKHVDQQRFERATKTMFGQRHPNIVELYNAGRKQGYSFTASQLIRGESAVELIRRIGIAGMLDPATVLQIAVDLCEALRFAEARSIVHRNIKPSNIIVASMSTDLSSNPPAASRRLTLLNDLILAKASTSSDAAQLTQAGDVLGDVSYMSPEQLGSGHPVDCRSDIYQLGVTLYALLTGRTPFEGGRFAETITQVLTADPRPVQQLHLATPAQFDTVVLKMLEKNPRDRFQTADEVAVALQKVAAETGQQDIKPLPTDPRATGWSGALDGLL